MNINTVRGKLVKKYGDMSVASLEYLKSLSHIPYGISAQCLSLDLVLGRPGFPAGRLCEIVGLESRGKCLVGETLIDCPRDLLAYPDGIPIKDLVGKKNFYTYSYSIMEKRFVLRKVKWVEKTQKNVPVMRVVWYDARKKTYGELIGTPDHKVLLYNGEYSEIQNLCPGDSLRPLRRGYHRSKPYADIGVAAQEYQSEHGFIYRELFGEVENDNLVHHDNGNKWDNTPSNLFLMTKSEHIVHHHTGAIRSDEARENISTAVSAMRRRYRDDGVRHPAELSMLGKKHSVETRAKISEKLSSNHPRGMLGKSHKEEARERIGEAVEQRWSNFSEEERAKRLQMLDTARELRKPISDERRIGMSLISKKSWEQRSGDSRKASEETKRKRSLSIKKYWDSLSAEEKEVRNKKKNNHEVISIEPWGEADCYDMEVEGEHNFVANEVVVHNSSTAYHLLAECQRVGGQSFLLTSEGDVEFARLEKLSVNTNDLLFLQPDNVEEAFEMIEQTIQMIRIGEKFEGPVTIVLDSIAGLRSSAEQAGGYDDSHMGLTARVIGQSLRKLMWDVGRHKVVLVFINRFYSNMNRYDPAGEYNTYGGKAVGYWASARVRVHSRKSDLVEEKKTPISTIIQATTFKNKIAVPFKATKYLFRFATGIDQYEDLWQSGLLMGIIKPSKGAFLINRKVTIERKDWEEMVVKKYKTAHVLRESFTQHAIKLGLLQGYGQ
jgi:RecA/RadA recombinase